MDGRRARGCVTRVGRRRGGGPGDRDDVRADPCISVRRFPAGRLVRTTPPAGSTSGGSYCRRINLTDKPSRIASDGRVVQVPQDRTDALVHGPVPLRKVCHLRVNAHRRRQHRLGAAHGDALVANACGPIGEDTLATAAASALGASVCARPSRVSIGPRVRACACMSMRT